MTHDEHGDFPVLVKQYQAINELVLDHHPLDVVGWDGYFYPWAFSIHWATHRYGSRLPWMAGNIR